MSDTYRLFLVPCHDERSTGKSGPNTTLRERRDERGRDCFRWVLVCLARAPHPKRGGRVCGAWQAPRIGGWPHRDARRASRLREAVPIGRLLTVQSRRIGKRLVTCAPRHPMQAVAGSTPPGFSQMEESREEAGQRSGLRRKRSAQR
ncbi:hypothetical protein ABQJ48_01815 [Paraburkholderia sp. DGU8]